MFSVGAQLRQLRAPLSTPQQAQRPVATSRPLPPILGRRTSSLDARQVLAAAAHSANLPGDDSCVLLYIHTIKSNQVKSG